jgi:hypothetical protein
MPLTKSSLAQQLEQLFNNKPATAADAAAGWANAYLSYASTAISSAASLPVNASASLGVLLGGFQGGLSALAAPAAGALVGQAVLGFWQAIIWVGPTAAGTTAFPGNASLPAALAAVFADLGKSSASEKANRLADAFDTGAKMVVVADIPFVQPAPPIVGPIQ